MIAQWLASLLCLSVRFNTLLAALDAAGLKQTVVTAPALTVFAPTDAAFATLPPGTVASLLNDVPALSNNLLYHVANGDLNTSELAAQRNVSMLQGASARIYSAFGRTYVNSAFIQTGNIDASNGIIHAISRVLMPPSN